MNEQIRVLMPIQVASLDRDVDIYDIYRKLNSYIKSISHKINLKDLDDWRLTVSVLSLATNGIGIYKRAHRYPSDKEFEISIAIPIPDNEQAHYGLAKVKEDYYRPLNERRFYISNPCFENYDNLYQYILESSKRAIDLAFTHGFTCNGKRIKLISL